MARVGGIVHRYGPRGVWEMIAVDRAGSALLGTLFLTIIVLEFGSMLTASDALGWSNLTVTTAGYGGRFPGTARRRPS